MKVKTHEYILSPHNYIHFILREYLNRNEEFLYLDLDKLANTNDKKNADDGVQVPAYFLSEYWFLLPSSQSKYHSEIGDGSDCFKWCSYGGRELVLIRKNDKVIIQADPKKIGTFNFISPEGWSSIEGWVSMIGHGAVDLIPYYWYYYVDGLILPYPLASSSDGNTLDEGYMLFMYFPKLFRRNLQKRYENPIQESFNLNYQGFDFLFFSF